jgi:SOS response regulatory protein OraA/RecX
MSLLINDRNKKYTPKTVSVRDLYHFTTKKPEFDKEERLQAQQALKNAGYSQKNIKRIVRDHEGITAPEMREVVTHLHANNVAGFADHIDPKKLVETYVRKQMVKNRNIARIRGENLHEAMQQDFLHPQSTKKSTGKKPVRLGF